MFQIRLDDPRYFEIFSDNDEDQESFIREMQTLIQKAISENIPEYGDSFGALAIANIMWGIYTASELTSLFSTIIIAETSFSIDIRGRFDEK